MDQSKDGATLYGDTEQYSRKHFLPACLVSVKLEPYEEGPSKELQPVKTVNFVKASSQENYLSASTQVSAKEILGDFTLPRQQSPQETYKASLPPLTMQQAQSRPPQGAPQPSQVSQGSDGTHAPQQVSSNVNRPTSQQPTQVHAPHQFPHAQPRPSEIAWLSHSYVDQNNQHFHTHQMQYVPNDAALLASIPPTQDGARIVKQNPDGPGGSSPVSCRAGNNPGNISAVPANESADSNAFISYVLNPQRGVPPPGIFLFDASRGLPSQSTQISNSREASSQNVQSGRSAHVIIRENSSDSTNTSESSKPGECHLVSRSCQTIVTMSQIQDAPLMSDAKIIITDAPVPEMAPEPEDSKDRVFAEADGEDSEEVSSMDSENECENLKPVTRLDSDCTEFGDQTSFSHQHGRQSRVSSSNENCDQRNSIEGVSETSASREGTAQQHGDGSSTSSRTTGSEILGNSSFPFIESDRPFRCDICGRTYTSQQALVNHERYHRGERPYECEICHKAFATNSHLVTHRRTHTGERPFQCQLCQRCFADRSAFVKHERTHGPNGSIVKRYKCDECGSGFVDSCGLKKHIRIHTGERPYVCSVCSKTFSTSSTFVAHKRIHTGERPYKCESCDKMFITKSHLLTHRRTHTGEKPFTCTICNRCFADGSSFRRHERLHTGENRHICMHCGRGFPLESSLEKHKQTHVQTGNFSYVYESRHDLHCLTDQQQPQPSCDIQSHRSARISVPDVRENSDRSVSVDLSSELAGEEQVNRNNMCAVTSREIDRDNQGAHPAVMVTAREVA